MYVNKLNRVVFLGVLHGPHPHQKQANHNIRYPHQTVLLFDQLQPADPPLYNAYSLHNRRRLAAAREQCFTFTDHRLITCFPAIILLLPTALSVSQTNNQEILSPDTTSNHKKCVHVYFLN